MSYDLCLCDPVTSERLVLDQPHHMRGGTYQIGGTTRASMNITYNYADHLYRVLPDPGPTGQEGIRSIYGLSGAEAIPILEGAISLLGDDVDPDYWKSTEGNTKSALTKVLALSRMRPDGVWRGD
jgi:hypothetical protein